MFEMSALGLAAAIRARKIGAVEAIRAYIGLIEKNDGRLNAFLVLSKEKALARANDIQARIDGGEALSPLAGVPIGIKDNISTAGIETTCASKILAGYVPPFSAFVVEKMESAGMISLGKLNMDEFAMGGSNETSAFGPARNPWDLSRVPGGSSGGSAAAVAAGLAPLALGTDTGGSVRQPCAFCGLTGIKPTYGAVSRYGLLACAPSLDQIGPMGRDIDDCAALLSVLSGPDEMDGTCVIEKPFEFGANARNCAGLKGLRVGLPGNYFGEGMDDGIRRAVLAAAREFEAGGAIVEEFEMPLLDIVVPTYFAIACTEASSSLSRYDGIRFGHRSAEAKTIGDAYCLSRGEGFGLEAKRRILLGALALSHGQYEKALRARALINGAYASLFARFDMLLSPVSTTAAYKIGENVGDPAKMYMGNLYTASINLAGLPAVALPCGFDRDGMPVGFQLVSEAFSEPKLIAAARAYQSRTDHHAKRPRFFGAEGATA